MTSYKVDEVDAGLRTLNDLLDAICEIKFDASPGTEDPRIDSLLWIARDLSAGVVERMDAAQKEKSRRAAA
jgi:hypothetical protein